MSKKTDKSNSNEFKIIADMRKLTLDQVHQIFVSSVEHILLEIDSDVEPTYTWENNELVIKANKIVVEDDEFNNSQLDVADSKDLNLVTFISLSKAQEIDPNAQVDDMVEDVIKYADLSQQRVAKIHNLFKQNLSKATKDRIYETYKDRIGELIWVKVENPADNGILTVSFIDDKETVSRIRESEARVKYPDVKTNSTIQVYIVDVLEQPQKNGTMVLVSTTSPYEIVDRLKAAFPEIARGEIAIKRISRKAGVRSKVAVGRTALTPDNMDPVATLIGPDGERAQNLSKDFQDEKIDFINFSDDHVQFMLEAIKPSRVISIKEKYVGADQYSYDIVVPNAMVSVAIGKGGVNAYLASEITRSRINIKSLDDATKDGDEILWNANVTEAELDELNRFSSTNKRVFVDRGNNRNRNQSGARTGGFNNFDMKDLDADFQAFESYFESVKNEAGPTLEREAVAKPAATNEVKKDAKAPKPVKKNFDDLDFEQINAQIEAADFDDAIEEVYQQDAAVLDAESARKARTDKRTADRLSNYTITDNDLADFALDGIDLDDLDDEDWD